MEEKINKRIIAHISEDYLQRLYITRGADTAQQRADIQKEIIDSIRDFVNGKGDGPLLAYDFTDGKGNVHYSWWLEDAEHPGQPMVVKKSMTENEFYTLGYMACCELATILDMRLLWPNPTEEEYQAVYKTRDLFARLLAKTISGKVTASEFFDNDTVENVRRYFSKANEADLIDLNTPTGAEEKALIAEADKQPKKDMPFWLRMVKALRGKEEYTDKMGPE